MSVPLPSQPSAPDPRRWWALAVIALTQLVAVLDATIVNVALPQAQLELELSDTERQWAITAYVLAFGALLLLGGRVADYWGRKRSYMVGMLGFGAASVWGGLAQSGTELIAARGLQGAFAALLAPAALALLTAGRAPRSPRSSSPRCRSTSADRRPRSGSGPGAGPSSFLRCPVGTVRPP